MPQISFRKPRLALDVPTGANLMESLLEAGLPVASSCHGDGVCAKCKIQVLNGGNNLSPIEDLEAFLKEKNSLPQDYRISCQTFVLGDVEIDTSYW